MNTRAGIQVFGIPSDHQFTSQDDLIAILLDSLRPANTLHNGDIIVITSKVVAKCEGRVVTEVQDRESAIRSETKRVVATKVHDRGVTTIVETHTGLILAAAGVDASNTEPGTIVLLPVDSDHSARRLREQIEERAGVSIGVIITDTLGRAWRLGVTDHAIGAAGVTVLDDLTGEPDAFDRTLEMTIVAVADEIAAASELVRPKDSLTPFAIVRGLGHLVTEEHGPGARAIIRPTDEDLFSLGTAEAIALGKERAITDRRTTRNFTHEVVPQGVILTAIEAAVTAPAPHHTAPWKFLVLHFHDPQHHQKRITLLDAMAATWQRDLQAEGKSQEEVSKRIARGDILRTAPCVVLPFVDLAAGAHTYPEVGGRNNSERDIFLVAGGAAVENLLISISAQGYGGAWISSTLFCPDTVRNHLGLGSSLLPLGAVAIGLSKSSPSPRSPKNPASFLID
ncbi:MAG: coenzyme F420-0:L-glutamate ligase [Candidatus Nanopelagicales bacterium]|nr:coenzyme F420-0:L-glutamate ligase [Actinomycetota bacterium]MBT5502430.1 coenzyme F420-0:L-glutamate ligase [Actinomycetota bacterium]NCG03038.1 coenzyme F420-0:L-glutamate ligase [Actinomycetales bacterium]